MPSEVSHKVEIYYSSNSWEAVFYSYYESEHNRAERKRIVYRQLSWEYVMIIMSSVNGNLPVKQLYQPDKQLKVKQNLLLYVLEFISEMKNTEAFLIYKHAT